MRDSLSRIQTTPAITDAQLDAMGARAWLDHGIILLRPKDMPDPGDSQALIDIAVKRYGRRADG